MISIIVPVLNEEKNIVEFQKQFKGFAGICGKDYEVIFSDGGSSDNTKELIDREYMIIDSERGRANQLNTAIAFAKGETVVFLHCDSYLEGAAFGRMTKEVNRGLVFGCFKIRFESDHFVMKMCGFFSNLRVSTRKIAFGDQGMVINKKILEHLGGVPKLDIMEDYQLSIIAKESGIKLKQINGVITTSDRRFKKNGIAKTMILMQRMQYWHRKGKSASELRKIYEDVR